MENESEMHKKKPWHLRCRALWLEFLESIMNPE